MPWLPPVTRKRVACMRSSSSAARGGSPAAFDGRCIPPGCVAPPSNTPGILRRRALPAGRLARLGATRDFHHGLLGRGAAQRQIHHAGQHGPHHRAQHGDPGVAPVAVPFAAGIHTSACTMRGLRSRAGLMAYPVVPPSERPIISTRSATGTHPSRRAHQWSRSHRPRSAPRCAARRRRKRLSRSPPRRGLAPYCGLPGRCRTRPAWRRGPRSRRSGDENCTAHQERAQRAPDELRREVGGHLVPRKLAHHRQSDGDHRVEMRSAVRRPPKRRQRTPPWPIPR